jgi:hypothetical protein
MLSDNETTKISPGAKIPGFCRLARNNRVLYIYEPLTILEDAGSGNDFIIIDHRQYVWPRKTVPAW